MTNPSQRREVVDDVDRVPDTSKDVPEEVAQKPPDRDEPGCYIWFVNSVLCFPAAALGGLVVAAGHGFALGLDAGFLGLVVGQIVSVALALWINADTTTDPEWVDLRDLPEDQRIGSGLTTRRKEKRADVAREVASAFIIFLAAPIATLLTALLIGWVVGE